MRQQAEENVKINDLIDSYLQLSHLEPTIDTLSKSLIQSEGTAKDKNYVRNLKKRIEQNKAVAGALL
jgi:hypothetical protein